MQEVIPFHIPQPRWEPDEHLIDATIAGRVNHRTLAASDRAWLVAHLTHAGHLTENIAAWLRCSHRTVQMIRTEPVYILTLRVLEAEKAAQAAASKAAAARVTPEALRQLIAENETLKNTRNTLIDQLAEARRRCDTPCPPPVVILRPPRRRAPRPRNYTMPLFGVGGEL